MPMRARGLLLLFFSVNAAALAPDDFAYRAQIVAQNEATWYRVPLPIAVQYSSQSSDLRDVRVFNAEGEVLPYSIVRATPQSQRQQQKHEVKFFPLRTLRSMPDTLPTVRVHESTAGTVIDVVTPVLKNKEESILRGWLLDTRDIDGNFEKLQLTWQGEIEGFQRFTVEASDDLQNWRTLGQGQIGKLTFDGEAIVQRDVELSTSKSKYLRLLWLDSFAAVELSAVQLQSANTTMQAAPLVWSDKLQPVRNEGGDSVFVLPAAISVERIRFENVAENTLAPLQIMGRQKGGTHWYSIGSGMVYRLPGKLAEMRNIEIDLSGVTLRELKLRIDQRGTGIPQPEISIGTTANTLVFLARGKAPYTLTTGNETLRSAELPLGVLIPAATTASKLHENAEVVSAEAGAQLTSQLAGLESENAVKAGDYKRHALWVVLVLGLALLAGMALQMLRKLPAAEGKD